MKKIILLLFIFGFVHISCEQQMDHEISVATISVEGESLIASYNSIEVSAYFYTSATVRNVVVQYANNSLFSNYSEASLSSYNGKFAGKLNNLHENSVYYIRYVLSNNYSSIVLEDHVKMIRTLAVTRPTSVTGSITSKTHHSASVTGYVSDDGGATVTDRGIVFATYSNPTTASNKVSAGSGSKGTYTCQLQNLSPSTTYYVRSYAVNRKGTSYGEQKTFTTDAWDGSGSYHAFSISATKQVTFSPGNLQYTQSTNTWSFAENQWDMIGTDNVIGGSVSSDQYGDDKSGTALADKIDLFGWSTSANNFGVSTSTDYNDYSGSFVDWGTNKIGSDAPNTWRTLTYDEWYYLRYNRTNANDLVGVAQVNGVNGLIFLPDNWTCPAGITFKSGFHSSSGSSYFAFYQTFNEDQWSKLEAAGAVFLPAAGYRYGSNVHDVQYYGDYWSGSATEYDSGSAYFLEFRSDDAGMISDGRVLGQSVRLVKDL